MHVQYTKVTGKYTNKVAHVHDGKRGAGMVQLHPVLTSALRWRWVVSFTNQLLSFQEKTRYPLNRRLGGAQSRLDSLEKRIISCRCWE
jgi:hypothetical protein